MNRRIFQLNQEWCMIHYPEKPNGFAVMVIGDHHHYVDDKTSFWEQHEVRKKWISDLTAKGYIVYYSHLNGANWGSDKAADLAVSLYQYIKRTEIINGKIHILAEGMGALVLKGLYSKMKNDIRSVVMFTPCVSLYELVRQEKEQKFFYKKFLKEFAASRGADLEDLDQDFIHSEQDHKVFKDIPFPLYIVQSYNVNRYKNQIPIIKDIYMHRFEKGYSTDLFYVLPEKRVTLGMKIASYFSLNEKEL
ncbi:hydrolase [Rossellomorea aquimaris]|uniref:hydrolase n=1 Tax=Rossellomorea aquimaris TaxID=189382 RepID=UPI001CD31BDE|nr:hydrolase [Rossellomorea aquimaris]MCA1056754.1 hydrolase [Rossellomorea aquimaris]